MSSPPGPFDIPQRLSLSAQAAVAIRKAIAENIWRDHLPSERRLCETLQVSRPTIRTALQVLAKEGVIAIHHGRRNRLLAPVPSSPAPVSRLVVLVSHQPLSHTTLTAYQGISEMRAHLAGHGFTTEVLVCPARSAAAQRRKLETFVRENRVFCCVLLSVSRDLQEWFSTHSIPALVLGSCHPDVKLPSLDVDYRSVCRHAVGVLRGRGHRRIAFLVPHSGVAGDLASEAGFREGLAPPRTGNDADNPIVRHNGSPAHIAAKLDDLFATPYPPTALLVAKPQPTLAVMIHLLRRGLKVPGTVSLIARDHDQLFENMVAHYRIEGESFAHRLTRLMLQMVGQGYLPPEPNLIFPRYVPGDTVRRVEPS